MNRVLISTLLFLAFTAHGQAKPTDIDREQARLLEQLADNAVVRKAWSEAIDHLNKAKSITGYSLSPDADWNQYVALAALSRHGEAAATLLRFVGTAPPNHPKYESATKLLNDVLQRITPLTETANKNERGDETARKPSSPVESQRMAPVDIAKTAHSDRTERSRGFNDDFVILELDEKKGTRTIRDTRNGNIWHIPLATGKIVRMGLPSRKYCDAVANRRLPTIDDLRTIVSPSLEGVACGENKCKIPSVFWGLGSEFIWGSDTVKIGVGERARQVISLVSEKSLSTLRWGDEASSRHAYAVMCFTPGSAVR